jgi:hypothetical protein
VQLAGLRGADLLRGKMPLRILNDLLQHFPVQPIGEEAGIFLLKCVDVDLVLLPKITE